MRIFSNVGFCTTTYSDYAVRNPRSIKGSVITAMKPSLFVVLCASLAACAGVPQHKPLPSDMLDNQKVVLVNQWAETHGARLIWIHYPTLNPSQSTN